MRRKIILSTAKKIITSWDFSNLDDVSRGGMTIDFKAAIVKLVVFTVQVLFAVTVPVSVFVAIAIGRRVEIARLKSWAKLMRTDSEFFNQHYYIEIKRHINEHKESYYITLNW